MQPTGAVLNHGTMTQTLARMHKALPRRAKRVEVLSSAQQQRLGNATCGLATYETRGEHARVICHEQIARIQVLPHIREPSVLQRTVLAMKHKQPTAVARLSRCLGYEFFWKLVVKVIGTHVFLLLRKTLV
jgi:hypothetical protein